MLREIIPQGLDGMLGMLLSIHPVFTRHALFGDESGGVGLLGLDFAIAVFIALRLRSGHYTDADVSVRQHRFSLYLFGGGCFVLGVVLFAILGAPRILVASLLAALVALAIGTVVTTRTRASVHAGVTAGCAAVLFSVSLPLCLLVSLAALTAGWARIYLHQHTPAQVILAWAIALVSVAVVFPVLLPLPPT